MNTLKNIYTFIIIMMISLSAKAQQDPMFSQYQYNPLSINPAYAGTKENFVMTGITRMQWVGIKDSPKTQSFSIHSPMGKNMGLGFTAQNDNAGPLHQMMFYADYSYQIDLGFESRLSFGLKAGFHVVDLDLMKIESYQQNDPSIYNLDSYFLPNVGVGIYFYNYNYYLGISAPRLLNQSLNPQIIGQSELVRHFFLSTGYVFDLDDIVKVKPSLIVRYTPNAPVSFDVSTHLYYDKVGFGVGYRSEDAFVGFFEFYMNRQLAFGYSYDYTMSDLRHESNGSHELMFRYDFSKGGDICREPKYF